MQKWVRCTFTYLLTLIPNIWLVGVWDCTQSILSIPNLGLQETVSLDTFACWGLALENALEVPTTVALTWLSHELVGLEQHPTGRVVEIVTVVALQGLSWWKQSKHDKSFIEVYIVRQKPGTGME